MTMAPPPSGTFNGLSDKHIAGPSGRRAVSAQLLRISSVRAMVIALFLGAAVLITGGSRAQAVPGGFREQVVFSGLNQPTQVRFAADGRVFVAEKSGLIKVFDGLGDTTPTVFADLRTQVANF